MKAITEGHNGPLTMIDQLTLHLSAIQRIAYEQSFLPLVFIVDTHPIRRPDKGASGDGGPIGSADTSHDLGSNGLQFLKVIWHLGQLGNYIPGAECHPGNSGIRTLASAMKSNSSSRPVVVSSRAVAAYLGSLTPGLQSCNLTWQLR